METQNWYSVKEFAPGSYQITEADRFNMFLFTGKEKALAVDGGIGVGDLRRLHESITDLPIEFVLTHTHWDHLGCAHQWERVGVHPNGRENLKEELKGPAQAFLKEWQKPLPAGFDPGAYAIRPSTFGRTIQEGDVLDIGDRRFRVYDTPGHSPCSVSLLDEREGVLVTGDLVKPNDILYLQVPTAVLSDYGPSLRKLAGLAGETKWICSGHTEPFGDASILAEMAEFVEEIGAGKHDPPKKSDAGKWGPVDEYEAPRFKVWVNDNARR